MTIQHLYPTTRPSLDLNFARTKRLDPRVTFTRGSTATYVGSDGLIKTAASNEARFEHDPVTGESLGLLVEESRTNLSLRSQQLGFAAGNWFANAATCTDNQGLAPDGTITAARLVPNTANTIHYLGDGTGASLSGTATISVFAKADGYNFIYLAFDYASSGGLFPGSAYFDLSTGQISLGASTTGSIQQFPNGWYRCSITATAGSTTQANPFVVAANSLSNFYFAGNGSSGILLWGFQFEAGSFPTSYIPTTSSTVTRSADVASMTGTNFSSWYNQSEGTVFADIAPVAVEAFAILTYFNTTSFQNSHGLNKANFSNFVAGAYINLASYKATSSLINLDSNNTGEKFKAAYSYKDSDMKASYQGGAVLSAFWDSPSPTNLWLGQRDGGGLASRTHLSRLTYYPVRLTDAQLQALTL